MDVPDPLNALREACRIPVPAAAEAIALGRTTWFKGTPTPASEGTIAIATGSGMTVVVNEDDVRQVKRDGEFFLVEVGTESNVLVRFEQVVKANPAKSSGGCGCDDKSAGSTGNGRIAREGVINLAEAVTDRKVVVSGSKLCLVTCEFDFVCSGEGSNRQCVPIVKCKQQCFL